MNKTDKRVLFVLGSGVSYDSGGPEVNEVTDLVFSEDVGVLQGDRHGKKFKSDERGCIHGFLRVLEKEITQMGAAANYESLYSLAQRIHEFEVGRLKDASMVRFRNHVYGETTDFWSYYDGGVYLGDKPLGAIAGKTCEYIQKCTRILLDPLTSPKRLQLIPCLIDKYGAKNVDILTLNHDRLVETLLKRRGIPYTTGFDPKESNDGQVDLYDNVAFDYEDRVRIVKLHGCVSWWNFRKNDSLYWGWGRLSDAVDWDGGSSNDWMVPIGRDGRRYYSNIFDEPITTGNTTKTEAYTRGITGEMYIQARRLLKEHDRIICSGYGFGDDGFNHMLAEWSRRLPEKKMLLLHNTELAPIERCWFWPEDWESNHSGGWFKHHPQWLSATCCSDVERLLF
ncbi:MAG: hypothetical protein ACI9FZ_001089 [Bacteroidia bacterium]|jgi:hypothetical protein